MPLLIECPVSGLSSYGFDYVLGELDEDWEFSTFNITTSSTNSCRCCDRI